MNKNKSVSASNSLTLSSGSGYYDLNFTFPIDKLVSIVEEVGVRGGHIGWKMKFKDWNERSSYDFGRKHWRIMLDVLEYIKENNLDVEHIVIKDQPQKGY